MPARNTPAFLIWNQLSGAGFHKDNICCVKTPFEFHECLKLFDAIPEWRFRQHEMSIYGTEWIALTTHWPTMQGVFLEEADRNWTKCIKVPNNSAESIQVAPKTFEYLSALCKRSN
jgi:hypothetical protein